MTVDPIAIVRALAREAGLTATPAGLWLRGVRLAAVGAGWATVEFGRAAVELDPLIADAVRPAAPDGLLGAAAWIWRPPGPEPALVLLEPNTEGRLAAALARRGEGPVALYLAPPAGLAGGVAALATAGLRVRTGSGPFGEAALVLGRPPADPQLILVGVPSGA